MTQKISPFLWLDKGKASEAAKFYTSVFKESKIMSPETFDNTPSADSLISLSRPNSC
jgi:predicted 3-demethylubiquinone-9 3-methyltransferase (glyoxalase superfamily)